MNRPAKSSGIAEPASRIVFWIAAYAGLAYLFLKAYELAAADLTATDAAIPSRIIDFLAYWAAAKLALGGEALAAFDPAALAAAAGVSQDQANNLLWLYPPAFMMLIAPLGALPFWAAWTVFVLVSAVCLGLAVRGPASVLPGGWRLIVVSPVVLIASLAIGQNSVLLTAALVAALWTMRPGPDSTGAMNRNQNRLTGSSAMAAGLWIALLTLKPQLCILVPLALAAGRRWRVLAWATGWAAAILLISTAAFGIGYWEQFLHGLDEATRRVEQSRMPIQRLSSIYGFARAIDAGHSVSLGLQMAVSAAMIATTVWIWSRKQVSHDLKCAALCAAIPLTTPSTRRSCSAPAGTNALTPAPRCAKSHSMPSIGTAASVKIV